MALIQTRTLELSQANKLGLHPFKQGLRLNKLELSQANKMGLHPFKQGHRSNNNGGQFTCPQESYTRDVNLLFTKHNARKLSSDKIYVDFIFRAERVAGRVA